MPMGRLIGISLALMAVSLTAVAKTTEKGAPGHHAKPVKAGARSGKPPAANRHHAGSHGDRRVAIRHPRRGAAFAPAAPVGNAGRLVEAYPGPTHPVGAQQIGEAAWYGFEGGRTASGERMDGITLTAAHRSLPLDTLAKVTNLDNGRSVIVKINDRGPVSHRFIIDLSRPAARQLGISGTAAVAVEPLARGPVLAAAASARPVAFPVLQALFGGPAAHPAEASTARAAAPATTPQQAATVVPFPVLRALFATARPQTPAPPPSVAAAPTAPKVAASAYP